MSLLVLFHKGSPLLVTQEVLDQMGLKNGQDISEAQVWQAISLNAAQLAADIDLRRLVGEKDMPDTTGLKKQLAKFK